MISPSRRSRTRSRLSVESLEDRLAPATFTVTNALDAGAGSLRQAILDANAAVGTDRIEFAIPGAGAHTINVLSALPQVTDAVRILGNTQAGFVAGAEPRIVLHGPGAAVPGNGLVLNASGCVVRALTINNFAGDGIRIRGDNNTVTGCFIGTNDTGNGAAPNRRDGIRIVAGAANNTIGGTEPAHRNLITANSGAGVRIQGAGATGNHIDGNIIGLRFDDALGALGNDVGVWVTSGATGNVVGGPAGNTISGNSAGGVIVSGTGTMNNRISNNQIGTNHLGVDLRPNNADGVLVSGGASSTTIANNLISGNFGNGVKLHGDGVEGNVVRGNTIGLNSTGIILWGNHLNGVHITEGASRNTIGGTIDSHRNVISGNDLHGVLIETGGAVGNVVAGNYIGTSADGIFDRGNGVNGVFLLNGARDNVIGGTASGSRNVISGNDGYGVLVVGAGTTGNRMEGNYIGLASSGLAPAGNKLAGVYLAGGASNNVVGGTVPGARNVISANTLDGVSIAGAGTTGNRVEGNFIGLDSTGATVRGNDMAGVRIAIGATDNVIGGTVPRARNVISGNDDGGIILAGAGVTGNRVQGNFIGTDRTGTLDRGNTDIGIGIVGGASNNTIGGATAAARNVISGNDANGVEISGVGTNGNRVQGNFVGTDKTGALDLGNTAQGVRVEAGATSTVIGGKVAGARNVISGNGDAGVYISGPFTTGTQVRGNYIGTDATGAIDLGNSGAGVGIASVAVGNFIGGTAVGTGNVISGNNTYGVLIQGTGTSANEILGNIIGLNATRTAPMGNTRSGVFITDGATDNAVGGRSAGSGNVISGNGADGVLIGSDPINGFLVDAGFGNSVLGNRINGNVGLGIDLGANDGVTPNDVDDVDVGPNNLMNFPVLTTALIDGSNLIVSGIINTHAFTRVRIEFFVNGSVDVSGYGEGQRYLGFIELDTGAETTTGFSATFTLAPSSAARLITATATDPIGSTSEFSSALAAV